MRRSRIGALIAGAAAAILLVAVGGCTTVTGGSPDVDASDAPLYKASVTASLQESQATSSARESERQASATTQAIHGVCETLSTTSADAVDALNAFVDAINGRSTGDPVTTGPAAVTALNNSADAVARGVTDTLPQRFKDAFGAWSDAARATAVAVGDRQPPDQFNIAVRQLNDTRSTALNLCDKTY